MSLTRLDLAGMVGAVGRGETSAVELATAHLDRIEGSQDDLNAYTLVNRDGALAAATAVDARIAAGDEVGPLAGAPVAVKDLIDQAGLTTTCGSSFYREVPVDSAPVVARLEAAGAVIVGRTGLHEFAFGFSSENHWFGPVRNPWDVDTSPGGSSGGSGAAVAAGLAAGALGTDTGGSVRVPAALCGIVGLKVTHGRVPLTGVFPLAATLDTVGPMARTTGDAALLYQAIAGDHPADPWSAPRPVNPVGPPADLAGLRVGVPTPWATEPVAAQVGAGFRSALDALADLGATVSEVEVPEYSSAEAAPMIAAYFGPEVAAVHRKWFPADPARYGPELQERMAPIFEHDPDLATAARQWRQATWHRADRLLGRYDVLATPACAATRKVIGEETIDVLGSTTSYRPVLSRFSSLVNHMGNPALAIPITTEGSPPPSLQLIGAKWAESRLLEIGRALEEAGVCGYRPPPIW